MAICNIPFSILLVIIGYPIFYLILQILLSLALICAWNWARILFGIGALVHGFLAFLIAIQYVPLGESMASIIVMVVGLLGGSLLLFSRSVKDFINDKR